MSDLAIQTRLQALIQLLEAFDDEDVTRGDYRILDRGSAPYAVILPGPFEAEFLSLGRREKVTWSLTVEVIERYLGDDYEPITMARQLVKDHLNGYRTLNGLAGVMDAFVTAGAALKYLYPEDGDVAQFVIAPLTVTVVEQTTVTNQE